jgi:dTDP-4-amino-4,6-dideoxygalactose transaminase
MSKNLYSHKILLPKKPNYFYSLLEDGLTKDDLNQGIKVLKSGKITMSKITETFEKKFKKKINAKYALMVNSGSSANLLAAFAASNPLRSNRFKKGDHAIIQSLCWPTSLWPLVQAGLKINFVDVDQKTLNVNANEVIRKINDKTKVVMIINVLGLAPDIKKIRDYCRKKKIILIEDNCEALGARLNNKFLGTFGDFSTFSFFYSHQLTAGEGGMIVCKNLKDYEILKSLRSHGWSREKKDTIKYPRLDPRYIFINSGFNLRPTDINAAIAMNQLKKLDKMIFIRNQNRNRIIKQIKKHKRWNNQFQFIQVPRKVFPSYMVLPILLNLKFANKKIRFINYLESNGIQTRPIISGNFLNQPSAKLFNLYKKKDEKNFSGSEMIQKLGFVIGLHTKKINKKTLNLLSDTLLGIDYI